MSCTGRRTTRASARRCTRTSPSSAAALIDPRVPDGGVEEVAQYGRPDRILLSNRHHLRHSECFADAFGCPIRCHEAGLWEFDRGPDVQPFRFGDEVAPGITALEMGALTPEDRCSA